MSFNHGRDTHVYFSKYDLSPYLNSASRSSSVDKAETTTYSRRHKSYIPGMVDGGVSFGGLWDGAAGGVDEMLEPILGIAASTPFTIFTSTTPTIGDRVYALGEGFLAGYNVSSPLSDVTSLAGEIAATGGVFSGYLLWPAGTSVTGDTDGTGVTMPVGSSIGYVANLHVITNSLSVTLDVAIEHSTDGTTWTELVAFTQVAAGTKAAQTKRSGPNTTVNSHVRATVDLGTTPSGAATIVVALHPLSIPGAS